MVSRQKLALVALFLVAGTMTMLSQNHASFKMIRSEEDGLPIVGDLILPSTDNAYGAWSLTLQLLTPAADLINKPQTVTRELEKVVSHTVSTHGLRLLGLTTVDPSRTVSRRLKGAAAFNKRTTSQLLIGSAVDDDSADEFEFEVETVNEVEKTNAPDHMSLFMRAIITSAQPNSDSVAALVHLAKSGEIFSWSKDLTSAGLPIDGIEIVSLAPHAPNSVEAKLQAQLLILQEEMNEIDSFDETHPMEISTAATDLHFLEDDSSYASSTLSAFSSKFAGGVVSLGIASACVSCLLIVAMMQAKRRAASAVTLAVGAASQSFIRENDPLKGAF